MGLNITKKEKERNVKVELAKVAGFCFGVKRAVEVVYEQVRRYEGQKIYTYGPIIHNEEVVKDLAKQGVEVIHSEEELAQIREGVVVICSHGVAKRVYDCMEEKGIIYVDATCPFVKKIHDIVAKESEKGSHIVIIGDGAHPEVEGTRGWAGDQADVIQTHEEARQFVHKNESQKLCIVSQTTFNYNKFKELVEIIEKKGYNVVIRNTICNATEERQTEAREIARQADAVIVIGGSSSSNTRKLYEICKNECEKTYYIQTINDLDLSGLAMAECIGITAGASTPNNIIEEVCTNVREFCRDVRGIN